MNDWIRTAVVASIGAAACGIAAWGLAMREPPACPIGALPEVKAPVIVEHAPAPQPQPQPQPRQRPSSTQVKIEKLELSAAAPGHVVDVDAKATREIADLVIAWSQERSFPTLAVEGTVYVRSIVDSARTHPEPGSQRPEALRACGDVRRWLLLEARHRLYNSFTCDKNVCTYIGWEGAPSGLFAFREVPVDGGRTWALTAWIESYASKPGSETEARNTRDVLAGMRRVAATSCP